MSKKYEVDWKFISQLYPVDLDNVESFKVLIQAFMRYHKIRGMEMLLPYTEDVPVFRCCGQGMVSPEGTPLEGVELWVQINEFMKGVDRVPRSDNRLIED